MLKNPFGPSDQICGTGRRQGHSHRQVRGAALLLWDGPALASAAWQPSDNGSTYALPGEPPTVSRPTGIIGRPGRTASPVLGRARVGVA